MMSYINQDWEWVWKKSKTGLVLVTQGDWQMVLEGLGGLRNCDSPSEAALSAIKQGVGYSWSNNPGAHGRVRPRRARKPDRKLLK